MKRKQRNIIRAWVLLLCFIAGQYVVYAHQHKNREGLVTATKAGRQHSVKEKCDLCDAMHHNFMDLNVQIYLPLPVSISYSYQHEVYNFTSISLILAQGRAPPYSS